MKEIRHRPPPEKATRRILEIANALEPLQGRIHIEKINEPFLFRDRGSPAEYGAGLKLASSVAGSRCTNPEPSSPSRRPAPSCSPDLGIHIYAEGDRPINERSEGLGTKQAGKCRAALGCQLSPGGPWLNCFFAVVSLRSDYLLIVLS